MTVLPKLDKGSKSECIEMESKNSALKPCSPEFHFQSIQSSEQQSTYNKGAYCHHDKDRLSRLASLINYSDLLIATTWARTGGWLTAQQLFLLTCFQVWKCECFGAMMMIIFIIFQWLPHPPQHYYGAHWKWCSHGYCQPVRSNTLWFSNYRYRKTYLLLITNNFFFFLPISSLHTKLILWQL